MAGRLSYLRGGADLDGVELLLGESLFLVSLLLLLEAEYALVANRATSSTTKMARIFSNELVL
jgi:hypothetical protein